MKDQIKPSELRIGNLVAIRNSERQYYYSITGHDIATIDDYDDDFKGDTYPIHLTPEILIMSGAIAYWCNEWRIILSENKHLSFTQTSRGEWNCYIVDDTPYEEEQSIDAPNIDNLHQLQNLYFALTGQELEVKLAQPLH